MLHRDAVSGGGYMMIGTVISADMDAFGQMPPNTKIRFVDVSLDEALEARAERRDGSRSYARRREPETTRRGSPAAGAE